MPGQIYLQWRTEQIISGARYIIKYLLFVLCLTSVFQNCKTLNYQRIKTKTIKLEIMPKTPIPVYIDTPENTEADTTPTFQERNREPYFRQKYPRSEDDYQGSNTYGVSLTIPNETYTIRELLNKHTSGIMPDVANEPIWQEDASHDSPDLQKLDRLDIVEKQIERERQTNIIDQLDEIVQEQRKLREQKQRLINESDSNDKTSESEAKAKNNVEDNE